jgi:excinuclease ABC subunit B
MQTSGRAARNVEGKVIFYADRITRSMKAVIDETERRRAIQEEYNIEHNITPKTIYKSHEDIILATGIADVSSKREDRRIESGTAKRMKHGITPDSALKNMTKKEIETLIEDMHVQLKQAAKELAFEQAAELRDEIRRIEKFYV